MEKGYKKIEDFQVGPPENVEHKVHVRSDLEWNGEDPFTLFQLTDKLGEGSFGSVWKVVTKDKGQHETALAIKQIQVNEETDIEDIEKEIKFLKECKSQYIVSYYGVYRLGPILWILMDYCALGSVADIMEINNKPFNANVSSWIILNALKGLAYLHSLTIVHRDVKGGNILVTLDGGIKLADFGVSEKLEVIVGEIAGTPLWMAPEVAKRGEGYNHKADIWSLGITLIELTDGEPPLAELNAHRVLVAIQRNDPPTVKNPKVMPHNLLDFLHKCLVKDVTLRWDTEPLLRHSFVASAKQTHIKSLIEKTIINKQKRKLETTAKIDHSSVHSDDRVGKEPDTEDDQYTIPMPIDDESSLYSIDELDTAINHSVLHHTPPKQYGPRWGAPSGEPLWAQPGYVPSLTESNPSGQESLTCIVEVNQTPDKTPPPNKAKDPSLPPSKTKSKGSPAKSKGSEDKGKVVTGGKEKQGKIGADAAKIPPESPPVDLDLTPRVVVAENVPLVVKKKEEKKRCCPSCTIL